MQKTKFKKKFIKLNYNGTLSPGCLEVKSHFKYFSCGEFEFSIQEDISGQEITIFQSFEVEKFNDDLIKLQIVCDVLKRNNVKKISYFAPFLPYTRQDRTCDARSSLGLKLIADIIKGCNITEVITYDLHALQIEGFFKCKVQNRSMIPKFIQNIKEKFKQNEIVIVFPDAGSASRFKRFFAEESFEMAIINKNRINNEISMKILGNVKGKTAIIIDDMIDGGGTLIEACKVLLNELANAVFCYATHGIFSGDAIKNLEKSEVKKITVSDSIFKKNHNRIESIGI